jgi:hypothetical protein
MKAERRNKTRLVISQLFFAEVEARIACIIKDKAQ